MCFTRTCGWLKQTFCYFANCECKKCLCFSKAIRHKTKPPRASESCFAPLLDEVRLVIYRTSPSILANDRQRLSTAWLLESLHECCVLCRTELPAPPGLLSLGLPRSPRALIALCNRRSLIMHASFSYCGFFQGISRYLPWFLPVIKSLDVP